MTEVNSARNGEKNLARFVRMSGEDERGSLLGSVSRIGARLAASLIAAALPLARSYQPSDGNSAFAGQAGKANSITIHNSIIVERAWQAGVPIRVFNM
jgi:hypothetical protein